MLACAALFTFGAAATLLYLIGELSFHTVDPRQALYYGGAAICAGVAIGLWLPRQVILRRMRSSSAIVAGQSAKSHQQPAPEGAGQAASLVGGLFLTTGAVLLLLLVGAETAESMRLQLTTRFTFPVQLLCALIWIPPLIGLTAAGACITTALVALHGLHRLVAASRARISELWLVIVAGGALSAFAIPALTGSAGTIVLALVPVFVAGLLASLRRWPRLSTEPLPSPAAAPSLSAHPLFAAAVSAAAVGYAAVLALSNRAAPPLPIAAELATGGLAAFVGLALGQWAGNRYGRHRSDLAVALFILGLTWVLPYHWLAVANTVRLFIVTAVGVACIVLATRRVAAMCESVQYVLSVVGVCVALGLTLALVSAPLWIDLLPAARIALLISLGIVAVVGILLLLDPRIPHRVRRPGLIMVGMWLLIMPALAPQSAAARPNGLKDDIRRAAASDSVSLGRGVLNTRGFRTKIVGDRAESDSAGWQIDMSPRQSDVVIVARDSVPPQAARSRLGTARRLLGRCLKTLRRGGRLVIEQPDEAITRAAFAARRTNNNVGLGDAYLLEITPENGDPYEAVLFGRDVPAWIAGRITPPNAKVALFPVESVADLRAIVAAGDRGG